MRAAPERSHQVRRVESCVSSLVDFSDALQHMASVVDMFTGPV
jgi:hypothetical protein